MTLTYACAPTLLGPVSINGRLGLRACVTNYRTTRADIDLIVDRIQTTPDGGRGAAPSRPDTRALPS